jgi:carboxypeptidase C (cathepsin A)
VTDVSPRPLAGTVCLAAFLAVLALFSGAQAEDVHAPKPEPKPATEQSAPGSQAKGQESNGQGNDTKEAAKPLLPPPVTTSHTLQLGGEALRYSAIAGALPLHEKGKITAEIFYVAYTKEPADADRPVTFVFNGGPGAASAYLHLGAIGPKIVEATDNGELLGPPPRLVDNDASWLSFTDLVFVDPVGTGYSRAAGEKKESDFWGVEQDTESLAEFIRLYLIENNRMASPVFLAGESYGGFRAVTLTRELQKSSGISPSGMVLVSPALEFAMIHGEDYDPMLWALALPSYAAVKLESDGVTGRQALKDALADAERYALTDYLVALASGAEQGGKTASARVADLTGLPLEKVEQHLARVSPSLFIKEFDRDGGQLLSRYDGSVSGPDPHPSSAWPRGPDPVLDATIPLWSSAFVDYAQTDLAYETDEAYRLLNRDVRSKWDFGTSPTRQGYAGVLDDIQEARAANPALEVMIATGYTDLITPYMVPTYLVGQLPTLKGATPITIEDYAGGHMLYLRPDSRRDLKDDVEAMYRRAQSAASQG